MPRFPNARGFVLHYTGFPADTPAGRLPVRTAGERASGPNFRLLARPLATTPEAEREAQPVVTPAVVLAYGGSTTAGRSRTGWGGRSC